VKIIDLLRRISGTPAAPPPPPKGEDPKARFLRIFSSTIRARCNRRPSAEELAHARDVYERHAANRVVQEGLDRIAADLVPEPIVHEDFNRDGFGTGGSWRRLDSWHDLSDMVGRGSLIPPPPSERTSLPGWLPSAKWGDRWRP
jgi:hypothetical protein